MYNHIPVSAASYTVQQFCDHHQIGRTTYFKIRKVGLGPKEVRVGKLIRITLEAEREWVCRMQGAGSSTEAVNFNAATVEN
ncbi:MAG: hypothetical protein EPN20_01540 [Magnetospirillum sp.]|nr:MAG: hypothetical protein EPN20_01540 [Magnetospirillum sp.]